MCSICGHLKEDGHVRPGKAGTESLDMYEQAFGSVEVRESPASEPVYVAQNFRQMDGFVA